MKVEILIYYSSVGIVVQGNGYCYAVNSIRRIQGIRFHFLLAKKKITHRMLAGFKS